MYKRQEIIDINMGCPAKNVYRRAAGSALLRDEPLVGAIPVSYTHLRAHETVLDIVCRLLLEKKKISRYTYHC